MRKLIKTFVAAVSAAVIATTAMIPVMAASSNTMPTEANLYIHRYMLEDGSLLGKEVNDGTEVTLPESAVALSDIEFDVYKIDLTGLKITNWGGQYHGYKTDADGKVTSLTYGQPVDGTYVQNDYPATYVETLTTDSTGTATNKYAAGYYFVVEKASDLVALPSAPYLIQLPMTNPTGDGWLTDVHTYPKGGDVLIGKEVSHTSVYIGDTVTWTLTPTAGYATDGCKSYEVTDPLDEALDYVNDSVVVKGIDFEGTSKVIAKLNYSVSYVNHVLKIKFKEPTVQQIADNIGTTTGPNGYAICKYYDHFEITFDTTINEKILERVNYTVENQAILEYTNKYDKKVKRESPIRKIHSSAIKVNKKNYSDVLLSGASFQIASSEANALDGKFLRKDADGNIVDFGQEGYDAADTWELTTTDDGYVKFEGLADYDHDGNYYSYYLIETKAPEGYELYDGAIKAEFNGTISIEANSYTINVDVKDMPKLTPPQTGGNGTYMYVFSALGIGLLALAIMVLTRKTSKQ